MGVAYSELLSYCLAVVQGGLLVFCGRGPRGTTVQCGCVPSDTTVYCGRDPTGTTVFFLGGRGFNTSSSRVNHVDSWLHHRTNLHKTDQILNGLPLES